MFSSEFKKFFGFEDQLEKTKFQNDKDLQFDTTKMNNYAILISSSGKFTPKQAVYSAGYDNFAFGFEKTKVTDRRLPDEVPLSGQFVFLL